MKLERIGGERERVLGESKGKREQKTREGGNFSSDRCGGNWSTDQNYYSLFSILAPYFSCFYVLSPLTFRLYFHFLVLPRGLYLN